MSIRTLALSVALTTTAVLTACGAQDAGQPSAQSFPRSTAEVKTTLTKVGETTATRVENAKESLTAFGEAAEKTVSATADTLEAFGNKVKSLTGDEEPAQGK